MNKKEMMFKLIYKDVHPDVGQTVELDGTYLSFLFIVIYYRRIIWVDQH